MIQKTYMNSIGSTLLFAIRTGVVAIAIFKCISKWIETQVNGILQLKKFDLFNEKSPNNFIQCFVEDFHSRAWRLWWQLDEFLSNKKSKFLKILLELVDQKLLNLHFYQMAYWHSDLVRYTEMSEIFMFVNNL